MVVLDVAEHVRSLTPPRAEAIGLAALSRVLADHTYHQRAAMLDAVLGNARPAQIAAVQA